MNRKPDAQQFAEIYSILEKSFPQEEYRTFEHQHELLDNKYYNIIFTVEDEKTVSVIAYWEFSTFVYIEHFATLPQYRGKGLGRKFLSTFLSQQTKNVILECELPTDDVTKKRIEFYKSLGFVKNKYPYIQPSMRKNTLPVPLRIMSLGDTLSELQFQLIKETLYNKVYHCKDVC